MKHYTLEDESAVEVSVFLKDYLEKLKNMELKKYYIESEKGFVIKDIHDFLKVVDIFQREKDKDRNATLKEYYFRGVSNKEWDLIPSLVVNDLEYYESVMMEEFLKAYPSEFEMDDSFEIIAKMQHFGLPTRVLDFTMNPLVALYFACSDMKQVGKDGKVIITLPRKDAFDGLDEYRNLIYTVHNHKFLASYLSKEPGNLYTYLGMVYLPESLYFKIPSYITEREKRQSSVFMLFANNIYDVQKDTCLSEEEAAFLIFEGEDYYKEHYSNGQFDLRLHPTLKKISKRQYKYNFTEIIIPARNKEQILEQLANIGIKKNYLFPEMEYTAEYIKNKYITAKNKQRTGKFDSNYDL